MSHLFLSLWVSNSIYNFKKHYNPPTEIIRNTSCHPLLEFHPHWEGMTQLTTTDKSIGNPWFLGSLSGSYLPWSGASSPLLLILLRGTFTSKRLTLLWKVILPATEQKDNLSPPRGRRCEYALADPTFSPISGMGVGNNGSTWSQIQATSLQPNFISNKADNILEYSLVGLNKEKLLV